MQPHPINNRNLNPSKKLIPPSSRNLTTPHRLTKLVTRFPIKTNLRQTHPRLNLIHIYSNLHRLNNLNPITPQHPTLRNLSPIPNQKPKTKGMARLTCSHANSHPSLFLLRQILQSKLST